ncbi:MAG: trehalose-6-phosphate synthase [Candidatus Aenigmarchaeota archaeon]|nr:trehalose-6-phosphate synthase [Candidatus Aenigmarchaeota archaeon]
MSYRPIIIANRCPPYREGEQAAGGLTAAFRNYIESGDLTWIGLAMGDNGDGLVDGVDSIEVRPGYKIRFVYRDQRGMEQYYSGLSNGFIWPITHMDEQNLINLPYYPKPVFNCRDFMEYEWTSRSCFSVAAIDEVKSLKEVGINNISIFIQDYHHYRLPEHIKTELGNLGIKGVKIAHFIHTPFPRCNIVKEIFKTDRATEKDELHHYGLLISGILHADLIGFHIPRYVQNFLGTVREFFPEAEINDLGDGKYSIQRGDNMVVVGDYPIGLDVDGVLEAAANAETDRGASAIMKMERDAGKKIIVGAERRDYTKGHLRRFETIHHVRNDVAYVAFAPPCREGTKAYQDYNRAFLKKIRKLDPERKFLHVSDETLSPSRTIALFRDSDGVLINTHSDGMNLNIFEAPLAQESLLPNDRSTVYVGNCGARYLLEQAGFGVEDGVVFVNPSDPEETARRIRQTLGKKRISDRVINWVKRTRSASLWTDKILGDLMD